MNDQANGSVAIVFAFFGFVSLFRLLFVGYFISSLKDSGMKKRFMMMAKLAQYAGVIM